MGIFVALENPTNQMMQEASMQPLYKSPLGKSYPKIQILTIADILSGKRPEMPPKIAPIQIATLPKRTAIRKQGML